MSGSCAYDKVCWCTQCPFSRIWCNIRCCMPQQTAVQTSHHTDSISICVYADNTSLRVCKGWLFDCPSNHSKCWAMEGQWAQSSVSQKQLYCPVTVISDCPKTGVKSVTQLESIIIGPEQNLVTIFAESSYLQINLQVEAKSRSGLPRTQLLLVLSIDPRLP